MREHALAAPVPESSAQSIPAPGLATETIDLGREPSALPRDHPVWQRDVVSISVRARHLLARLRPVGVRVLTFWDHVRRGVTVAGRTLEIDPSGSYRLR
jgi:hypothetical protein